MKTGLEVRTSSEAVIREHQEADPVRGVFGARGEHETAEVRDVRRAGGGCGLRGGAGKRVDGVSPGRPQSFRYQRRPVDDCSPG